MKLKPVLFIFAIVLILQSCGRVTDEDLAWQLQEMPVVFCILTPDNPVSLSLAKTIVLDEEISNIYYPDAKVYIAGENKAWIELTRDSYEKAIYRDEENRLNIEEGKKYFLRIDLENELTITAETKLPLNKSHIVSSTLSDVKHDYDNNYKALLQLEAALNNELKTVLLYNSRFIDYDQIFLTNKLTKNEVYFDMNTDFIQIKLLSFEHPLANFLLAEDILSTNIFSNGDVAPLMGTYNGILPPYSNISNGIGLFAGYVSDSMLIEIEK